MLYSFIPFTLIRSAAGKTAGLGLALLFFSQVALADSFVVQPAQLTLAAKNPAATLRISNPGNEDVTVQFQVMEWTEVNGRVKQSPSRGLIVHPERLTLKPGSSQNVRVGLRLSAPRWVEDNYRLVLSEIRQAPDVGAAASTASVSHPLTRTSLPVVVLPPGRIQPDLVTIAGGK